MEAIRQSGGTTGESDGQKRHSKPRRIPNRQPGQPAHNLADELALLEQMDKQALQKRWSSLTSRPVPRVSAKLLRLALAWELQAAVHGGLPRRVSQRLDQLANGRTTTQRLTPGMRLAREHDGRMHIVTIGADGAIEWNDRQWKSLSAVARAITGTRWSGPAFFGLKQKADPA